MYAFFCENTCNIGFEDAAQKGKDTHAVVYGDTADYPL